MRRSTRSSRSSHSNIEQLPGRADLAEELHRAGNRVNHVRVRAVALFRGAPQKPDRLSQCARHFVGPTLAHLRAFLAEQRGKLGIRLQLPPVVSDCPVADLEAFRSFPVVSRHRSVYEDFRNAFKPVGTSFNRHLRCSAAWEGSREVEPFRFRSFDDIPQPCPKWQRSWLVRKGEELVVLAIFVRFAR